MTHLGERFREAREARGLSITEASTATRILPRYLQAIEAGDVASLPGDVYARGFIRNYAQLLGLPAEEMIALYRQERGEPTSRIKVVPAAVPPRTRSCLIPSFFVTFFTVLLLLAGAYVVLLSTGMLANNRTIAAGDLTTTPPPPTATSWPTQTPLPPDTAQSALPPPITMTPAAAGGTNPVTAPAPAGPTPTPAPPTPTAQEAPVVVQATVLANPRTQGSWMAVTQDGAAAFTGIMQPGQTQTWRGQREIFLNIGDTSVVQLTLNGQPVPGFPGAVRGVPRKITCGPQGCG
jgi:cytoskeletal protein RodZ